MFHARLFQHDVTHAAQYLVGAVECRRFRELRERHQVLLVLLRNEARRHRRETEPGQADQAGIHDQRNAGAPENSLRRIDVSVGADARTAG